MSPNGQFRLAMSSNGNLFFQGPDGRTMFDSGTTPGTAYILPAGGGAPLWDAWSHP